MNDTFAVIVFAGSWLLFAGPVFQAALELRDQDIERDRIYAAAQKVEIPQHVSVWWWLFPPIKLWLEYKQSHKWRREHFRQMAPADRQAFLDFSSKAKGWMMVAGGGLLVAADQTWSLGERFAWSKWLIFGTMLICAYLSLTRVRI